MTATSSDGGVTWANVRPVVFSSGVRNATPDDYFYSVSCSGSTCVAAGEFNDVSGNEEGMTATSSDGGVTWANAQPAVFSSGVQNATPDDYFYSVSCSGSNCAAAGQFYDVNGNYQSMTETSTDGGATWSVVQPAVFSSGVQNATPDDYFYSVSCSISSCVAAGEFNSISGNDAAMTETELLASAPSQVANLAVMQIGTTLSASWSPSPDATNYTCTLLYGFNTPSTFTTTTSGPSCTFYGVSATTPYGVSVVANSPGGNSAPASAFSTPTPVPTTTTTVHKIPPPPVRTIVCVRGTHVKRVRGQHPKCPAGYKQR